jgi:RNA polymerase sigma-70 factor (ECF subfamily)
MATLVERYQGDVLGICVRMLRNRHDAEDVAQEVFLRVFRSLRKWDKTRPLRPWILTIAVNRCRSDLGQRSRRPNALPYVDEVPARPVLDDGEDLTNGIQEAVSELRPEYRLAFTLFHEQGLAYEYVAQALSRPVGTIKTWLHRARLEVFRRLQERGLVPEAEHDVR